MLGKPVVVLSLTSHFAPIRPLGKLYHPLMTPLLSESSLWYLLNKYKQIGVDTICLLLSPELLSNFKNIKPGLLRLGLNLKVIDIQASDWKTQILDWVSDEDPVFVSTNPLLDTECFRHFLQFHQAQQSDCSFKLRKSAYGAYHQWYLDSDCQVSLSDSPGAQACYDSSEYILEADILEALLENSKSLSVPGLARGLNELSQYISGYLTSTSDSEVLRWENISDYWQLQQRWLSEQSFAPQGKHQQLTEGDACLWVGEDAFWDSSVRFKGPVVIGRQVVIQKNVQITGPVVIGDGVRIDNECQILRSCLWPRTHLAEKVLLADSCLAEGVKIAAGSIIKQQWVGSHSQLSLQSDFPTDTYWGNYSYCL